MEAKETYWEGLTKIASELFKRGLVEHSNYSPDDATIPFCEEVRKKTEENLAKELNEIFQVVGFLNAIQFDIGELVNKDVLAGG